MPILASGFAAIALAEFPVEELQQLDPYAAAACQLDFRDYSCSGVLLNNTREPGRPLILTAAHCIERAADLEKLAVTVGYRNEMQSPKHAGWQWRTEAGVEMLSSSRQLDFALLELKEAIPAHVAPVFLGWSSGRSEPGLVFSIHSRKFGPVEFAASTTKPAIATFEGIYGAMDSGFWQVDGWYQGDTSMGSSGAPLLNSEYQVIGGLSGSTDWPGGKSDFFFRFDLAYDHFDEPHRQLKAWIDPKGLGQAGHYEPAP